MPRRFFRHGELPLVLLALLARRPMHPYDLVAELGRLFGPGYRPSPGSVYPAVEALRAEGLLAGELRGGRTVYSTTEVGFEALDKRAEMLAAVELRTGTTLSDGGSIEPLLARFKARVAPLGGHVDPSAVEAVLERAAKEIEALDGLTTGGAT